ncbi:MAG: hypothetical protein DME36_08365, partial [Verrucomicrobia bacterium]
HIARLDAATGLADSFDPNANGSVAAIAVQADGKILVGGFFGSIGGQTRSVFARLSNDTAALQNLAVTQTTVTWTRGGSSAQFIRVTFESSIDNVTYTVLGNGTASGSNWTLTGLNLSTGQNLYIRARGYYRTGYDNASESTQESVRNAFLQPTGSATWKSSPATADWNTASNWSPATVPNGASDTATFASSSITNISLSANTEVNGIVFNSGASAFTITTGNGFTLTISGAGIMNNSGLTENLSATGGSLLFKQSATAANARLTSTTAAGSIQFLDNSSGGTASLVVNGGTLDISAHAAPDVTIGSLEGSGGSVSLGSNNLTVGSNNLSKTFSGVTQDGGIISNTGGSLTKIGKGKLTLSNGNTYTGGTTINQGSLLAKNKTGSATGTGAVQVNGGTLGGTGTISGTVTVATGTVTSSLAPGITLKPGTLTLLSTVAFNSSHAFFKVDANSTAATCDKLVANGVTINSAAQFVFTDHGTGTLPAGTVFILISNTAATAISGTFSNLADGSTFTNGANTYLASYHGGNGNDLTLTVQ